MYFIDHPQRPTTRPKQKRELQNNPGMQQYLQDQDAVDAKTARLRALRIAKEEAAAASVQEPRTAPRPAARKTAARRGIGSS